MPRSALESNLMMLSHIGNRNESHNKNVQRVGHRKINEYFQLYTHSTVLSVILAVTRFFSYPFLFRSMNRFPLAKKFLSLRVSVCYRSCEKVMNISYPCHKNHTDARDSRSTDTIGNVFSPSVRFSSIFFAYSFISFTFHTINFMCLNS